MMGPEVQLLESQSQTREALQLCCCTLHALLHTRPRHNPDPQATVTARYLFRIMFYLV